MTTSTPASTTLTGPGGRLVAAVLPGAGMLIPSLSWDGHELLGQRRGVSAYLEAGKTMGIPLLAPWANRVWPERFTVGGVPVDLGGEHPGLRRDPNGRPIHGLLAADPGWAIDQVATDRLLATLDFGARPELLAAFPFPHRLTYGVTVEAAALVLELTVTPTAEVSVPVAHGLHPYLALPGVPRAEWHVALPARTHLALDDRGLPTGASERQAAWGGALGARVFDDAYDGLAPGAVFTVSGGGWRIDTTFEAGYPAGQLFAPGDDAVVCFEPMAAPTNALATGEGLRLVAPGTVDTARVRIALEAAPA
ncbi:MAG: aldose 1-epimerase [Patulibacter minatonensis]